ncbi:MAG: type II toxin-antitoxin system RelE/ParE family toxin [Candidatus Sulfotelmatobacter sp.]
MPSSAALTAGFWRWPKNPRPAGCKKLKGHKDQWRIRIGEWRVIYFIDDAAKQVSITRVAHRREVYDG